MASEKEESVMSFSIPQGSEQRRVSESSGILGYYGNNVDEVRVGGAIEE